MSDKVWTAELGWHIPLRALMDGDLGLARYLRANKGQSDWGPEPTALTLADSEWNDEAVIAEWRRQSNATKK